MTNKKKNTFIQSMGLNDPAHAVTAIKNIYYNYTHNVVDTNSAYTIRPLTSSFNKCRFAKLLNHENISFQSDVYVEGLCFDFLLIYTEFLVKIVTSIDNIDIKKYNNVAAKNNLQCYFLYDFDKYDCFAKSLVNRYTISSEEIDIKQVSNSDAIKFYNKFSLYHADLSYCINIAAIRNNSILACMSFRLADLSSNSWVIANICNKYHYSIINGNKLLLQSFIQSYSPDSISAMSDLSKSNGMSLYHLGLKLKHEIPSENIYTKYKCGISHSLIKDVLHVPDNIIEDMMIKDNYNVVHNLGYQIFEENYRGT